jgi:hypothetical protein
MSSPSTQLPGWESPQLAAHSPQPRSDTRATPAALATPRVCRDPGGSETALAAPAAMSCRRTGSESTTQARDRAVSSSAFVAATSAPSSSSVATQASEPAVAGVVRGVAPSLFRAPSRLGSAAMTRCSQRQQMSTDAAWSDSGGGYRHRKAMGGGSTEGVGQGQRCPVLQQPRHVGTEECRGSAVPRPECSIHHTARSRRHRHPAAPARRRDSSIATQPPTA